MNANVQRFDEASACEVCDARTRRGEAVCSVACREAATAAARAAFEVIVPRCAWECGFCGGEGVTR